MNVRLSDGSPNDKGSIKPNLTAESTLRVLVLWWTKNCLILYAGRTKWNRIQWNLIKLVVASQTMIYSFLTKFRVNEWMAGLKFSDKIIGYLRTKSPEKQIFVKNIRHTASWNPGMFFSTFLLLPLLNCGVHPEGLGIVMDKKLLNTLF